MNFWRPVVSRVSCFCTAERGARARELPQPRTQFVVRGGTFQRTHLATSRQPYSTLRWSYPCLGHILWPETALSNALTHGNASAAIFNAAAVTGLILRWAKTDNPSLMYKSPEKTDNHLPRSSAALRFPVTRKKSVAPPRLRECKV